LLDPLRKISWSTVQELVRKGYGKEMSSELLVDGG